MGWQNEKIWSDRFLPEMKSILGWCLIAEAPIEEDVNHNTDLIVLKLEAVRIGCRVRRHKYIEKYSHEFTIRSSVPSGHKTELAKVIEGWGQYLLYGFCDEQEKKLAKWTLIDLNVFRLWIAGYSYQNGGQLPGEEQSNRDGSSKFYGFDLNNAPNDIVFKKGERT